MSVMEGGKVFKWGSVKTVCPLCRGRARTVAASEMEFFATVVNRQKSLFVFRKSLILDFTVFLVLALLFPLLQDFMRISSGQVRHLNVSHNGTLCLNW